VTDSASSKPETDVGQKPAIPAMRVIRSDTLLQGEREVAIQHGSEFYRLRLTKTGKLILNK
jgi:hemin uptake protein HemP